MKPGDIIEMEVIHKPKWWQFWKKPKTVVEKFVCKHVIHEGNRK